MNLDEDVEIMSKSIDFYLDAIRVNPKAINYMPEELLAPEFYSQAIKANSQFFIGAIANSKNLFKFPLNSQG